MDHMLRCFSSSILAEFGLVGPQDEQLQPRRGFLPRKISSSINNMCRIFILWLTCVRATLHSVDFWTAMHFVTGRRDTFTKTLGYFCLLGQIFRLHLKCTATSQLWNSHLFSLIVFTATGGSSTR